MLTERLSSLISLAARKSLRKPTSTIPVASMMLPATVMKSKPFQPSLKYGCNRKSMKIFLVNMNRIWVRKEFAKLGRNLYLSFRPYRAYCDRLSLPNPLLPSLSLSIVFQYFFLLFQFSYFSSYDFLFSCPCILS